MEILGEQHSGGTAAEVLLWIQASVNVIAILFDLQLICFHRWLDSRDISTFDYITYKREQQEMKDKLKVSKLQLFLILTSNTVTFALPRCSSWP